MRIGASVRVRCVAPNRVLQWMPRMLGASTPTAPPHHETEYSVFDLLSGANIKWNLSKI